MKEKILSVRTTAVLVIIVAAYLGAFLHEEKSLSTGLSPEDYASTLKGYTKLVYDQNPRVALAALRRDMKEKAFTLSDCHTLAHDIGRESYRKYRNFGDAASYFNEVCASGYLHGAIETHLSQSDTVLETMQTTCTPYLQSKFLSFSCYHGMGHALMYYTNNDLPQSLEACEKYEEEFAREGCVGGVFMANFSANPTMHPSKYLKKDDVFYPCREQTERNKNECYAYVPWSRGAFYEEDYFEAFAICKNAEPPHRKSCAFGAGALAAEGNIDDLKILKKICTEGEPSLVPACIDGAARIIVLYTASNGLAKEFCETLQPPHKWTCHSAAESQGAWFETAQESIPASLR